MKNRLANVIDEYITDTQYRFRAKRSTSQASHVVRRVGEYAEMGGSEMHMALLNWEKAFDRIYHDKLFESLRRYRIPEKMVKVIKS
eukprot:9289609-Karenia_brevis.AAC.1